MISRSICFVVAASLADDLLARHAIFSPQRGEEERLRDEPKERLRGRLGWISEQLSHCQSLNEQYQREVYSSPSLSETVYRILVLCEFY